jgi:hypothetical protein
VYIERRCAERSARIAANAEHPIVAMQPTLG